MDDRPVLMCITAKANKANGMALLSNPTKSTGRQCWRKTDQWPLATNRGSKNKVAMATRKAAVGSAPSSRAASRMNMKEAPQMAASIKKSANQPRCGVVFIQKTGRGRVGQWDGLRASKALVCATALPHSR